MYRFVLSRRWVAAHLAVVAFIVACGFLARWQLHRLAEKKAYNAAVEERGRLPIAPLASLLKAGASSATASSLAYRRVEVDGTFDASREFQLLGQTSNAVPGTDVLTPLVVASGVAIIVDRGFAPMPDPQGPLPDTTPSRQRVHVTGILLPSERGFGRGAPTPGSPGVSHIDIGAIAHGMPYALYPDYLRLIAQSPAQSGPYPAPVPVARIDLGPHLSYAVQWCLFAAVAFFGWIFYVRKVGRDRARAAEEPPAALAVTRSL